MIKRIIFIFICLLLLGAFFIIAQNNLPLNTQENITKVTLLYKDWLASRWNDTKSITAQAIKQESNFQNS